MKVRELKAWLERMVREDAEDLTVEVINHEGAFDQVRLAAVEANGTIVESVILTS